MIPKQLKLQNFLSYREVVLDFDGLHVACVCGPNGAGKSSLLEAIAWCVWGQSRVSAEDDVVRQGAMEAQVSFCFGHDGQCYRIIRTRRRNQSTALEFQIQTTAAEGTENLTFKSLTQKGVRATQQYILQQLKIDYETFVNAAYLRQGRADEFMLKRPSERKQVLADLLKLSHYDRLAEQAKDRARTYKAQIPALETFLAQTETTLNDRTEIQQCYEQLLAKTDAEKKIRAQRKKKLKALKKRQQQRHVIGQHLALAEQKQQHCRATWTLSQTALGEVQQQLEETEKTLAQASEIQQQYQNLEGLRQQEERLAHQFDQYQQAQAERLGIQQRLNEQSQAQQQSVNHWEAELSQLEIQTQALLGTLEKKAEVDQCLETLNEAKEQLRQLDKKEADSAPLRQRLTEVQGQIAQVHTRLLTKIELLDNQQTQMTAQHLQPPQLMQAVMETEHKLAHLEKRRDYQEAVRQKGIERRSFMERLQANQLNHEVELAQLDQRLQLLSEPDGAHCPLCEQALVEETRTTLQVRTAAEKDEIQNQIWTIREQLAVSESEIQVLRREYRVLEDELAKYAPILEERGQLKAKLASVDDIQGRLQVMTAERSQLERCLQENDYAADLQGERQQIEAQLAEMAYDDRDHALVRSQVDRLRWSEIKRAEIKKAERQLAQIREQQPELEDKIQAGRAAIAKAQSREDIQRLQDLEQCLHEMDYSLEAHDLLRAQLRDAREWETRYQQLQQATEQKVVLGEKREQLQSACDCHEAEMKAVDAQVEQLKQQLASSPEAASKTTCKTLENEIVDLEDELVSFSEKREQSLAQLGRLQQQLSQLETLEEQQQKQQKNLADTRHKYQVYRSLAEAFGRNGIQALMIENLLPQLEAMTNQVLGRLSNHQLHVQFVTQRAGRKKNKLIDTLDILIADVRGTRPYETYSGGEAFRVNFAIRLAIARLLAMRSGTALQMLIVDEGFGTQDREGCDRLIAAIEAIAPDFACILTITHMPHFREAFQTRIDVSKDEAGSHIMISA